MIARNTWEHVGRSTINGSVLMSFLQDSLPQAMRMARKRTCRTMMARLMGQKWRVIDEWRTSNKKLMCQGQR
jgi:hypothetical protein